MSPTVLDLFIFGRHRGNTLNLFRPGSLNGIANPAIPQRSKAYNRDYVNPAPRIGVAEPRFKEGILGKLAETEDRIEAAITELLHRRAELHGLAGSIRACARMPR